MTCSIVPPYLLQQIARAPDARAGDGCHRTLSIDDAIRQRRQGARPQAVADGGWTIHTAGNTDILPGEPARARGEPPSGDAAVNEAYDGIEASLAMFADVFDRDSYDGASAHVNATVHYEQDYDNAFWDGTQLVVGDGDGEIFDRFTKSVDVLAHEFTHAVTEHVAGLVYEGQSGALNESVSDVFAACLKQRLLGQTAAEGDWLIGADLFMPGVSARGLRDMANPGTAYDDPVLGVDPQGADMDGYVETTDDNGGVHLNSGIPNRAFQLAAVAVGGTAAEGAGRIWWQALDEVPAEVDFAGFAAATLRVAGAQADAVRSAWQTVGVVPGTPDAGQRTIAGRSPDLVEVRRSGGFAGRGVSGQCELTGDDPRTGEIRELLDRVDLRAMETGRRWPDMYVYTFMVGDDSVSVVENQMTDDLKRLASLLLDQ
ncbi:MAG: M4 family metallopeptidase [Nocardioides sp.]|nr:M4 family metallopeptidase [Nocardioides sp.]